MRHLTKLVTAVLLLLIVTACAAPDTDSAIPNDEIEGPALIVFYTDN